MENNIHILYCFMKYFLCDCVCVHAWRIDVQRLQCRMFFLLGLQSSAWAISKGLPTSPLSDSPRRWCTYHSLSSVEFYPWDLHKPEHKSLFLPPVLPDDWAKKHLHHSPGLKQRNLWSLADKLGKVPDIKAKKLFLCEGLLWHNTPEVAWRLVPTAPGGGMQATSEGHRDREGKGWKREGSSCGTN